MYQAREGEITKWEGCRILRGSNLMKEDLWIRDGKIVDPEKLFFEEKRTPDVIINCPYIISPGFIDIQINGAVKHDFATCEDPEEAINAVSKFLLQHGVTSFCPTLVTSSPERYRSTISALANMHFSLTSKDRAENLGVHLEGPFLNEKMRGAHEQSQISTFENGMKDVIKCYSTLEGVAIVTLAPELENSESVIKALRKKNIKISIGHSEATLQQGEDAVIAGATCITHLYSRMSLFHHRDPGLLGVLASDRIGDCNNIFYGLIADNIHAHPAAQRIAYKIHPQGLILVSDAVAAAGLEQGNYKLGEQSITVHKDRVYVTNTNTLAGSIATIDQCVRNFIQNTNCPVETALNCATLHPAKFLAVDHRKGTLNFGADADLVILDNDLNVIQTVIAGNVVYQNPNFSGNMPKHTTPRQ